MSSYVIWEVTKWWTGDVGHLFGEWKLFSAIQVSSTDLYMISAIVDTWHWTLQLGDIY